MTHEAHPDASRVDGRDPASVSAAAQPPSQLHSICHVISGDRWAGAEVQAATLIRALCRNADLRVSAIVLNEGRLAG